MPSKNALNVSLTEQLCEFVEEQVASGRFRTASEVVRAALRGLEKELRDATAGERGQRARPRVAQTDVSNSPKRSGSNLARSL